MWKRTGRLFILGVLALALPGFGQNRVFVTNDTFSGNLGGLAGGDTICQREADAVPLGGSWVAWLSTVNPQVNAVDRLSAGSFALLDSTPVAASIADLTDGNIANPINLTPTSQVVQGPVWTGTATTGLPGAPPNDCTGWTAGPFGWYGEASRSDGGWTFVDTLPCDDALRLYCFEVQAAPTLPQWAALGLALLLLAGPALSLRRQ
ncbi:MAG: hypothetical protein GTO03_02510 [Planctomycetales bacterium]|nr:hypothetical protein [Planctomycetales bacterium]